ncbi:MAG: uracil-xanthine permease family protein [Lachnospiraceae bacterium]|nr:uracil-xanthine permease family protein [Lachnospiraceae bacterium]
MEETKKDKKVSGDNIYKLDGQVPLGKAIFLGIQHISLMFLGNITAILIIAGIVGMDSGLKISLVQNSMFVAGIVTLIQLYPVFKVGAGLPLVMGTSSAFISTNNLIASSYGYPAVLGASLVGGLFETVLGFFIKPLRKLFPPIVTNLVILNIGLSLLSIGIQYFGGGSGNYGTDANGVPINNINHLIVATLVLVVIVVLRAKTTGFLNASSILIGIIVGYIVAIFMGMVDFTDVREAAWFSLPTLMPVMPEFKLGAIIPMCIMFIATTIETMGDTCAVSQIGLGREAADTEISGAVKADGLGSAFATLFGCLPNTTYSQNVGLVNVTKVVNRFTIMTGAIFLILCGFCPKLSAILSVMPQSVLGGAAVIMFSSIFLSGIQGLLKEDLSGRNGMIVMLSMGIGVGIANTSSVLAALPSWVTTVFGQNGIIMTFVIATIANLLLPQDKPKEAKEA